LHFSDLASGEMPSGTTFEEKPYVWFEHNVSPDLLAEIQREGPAATTFSQILPTRHTRVVAIVSAAGMELFMERALNPILHALSKKA
jgi:hypothetical protein